MGKGSDDSDMNDGREKGEAIGMDTVGANASSGGSESSDENANFYALNDSSAGIEVVDELAKKTGSKNTAALM